MLNAQHGTIWKESSTAEKQYDLEFRDLFSVAWPDYATYSYETKYVYKVPLRHN